MATVSHELVIQGKKVALSNLDKVFYPEAGFTKGDVLNYYVNVAPVLLPHLEDRLLTLKRYPDGVDGDFFYQKECPPNRPRWLKTGDYPSTDKGRDVPFCMANDLPSLIWLVNMADLEFHTLLSQADDLTRPTMIAFDLDPGAGADMHTCAQIGLLLRDALRADGLDSYPKTSGSKGLQVYVPLNTPTTFDATKEYARSWAQRFERTHPKLATSNMRKDLRVNKVFIDWSQNVEHKTTVTVYSLRAKSHPTASTPVRWDEVEELIDDPKATLRFEAAEVLGRVERFGDLFAAVLKKKQRLPSTASSRPSTSRAASKASSRA